MEIERLQEWVASHQWGALLPELLLGVAAVLLLFVDLGLPRARPHLARIAIAVQLLAAILVGLSLRTAPASRDDATELFAGLLVQSQPEHWMRLFFLLCGILVTHLAALFLRDKPLAKVELYHLILVLTAGFMVLAQSAHFILLFVALETVTVGFYILVAYNRNSRLSLEAGLKYLVMGALSSGILLFGIALLYGAAGNPGLPGTAASPLNFAQLGAFISAGDELYYNRGNFLVLFGCAMVLCGIAFKIGVVPFQIWIPDVYQGAPTPVTALLAVASKAAGFYLLYVLISGPFADLAFLTIPLLSAVAVLTIIFGNVAALGQRNVKRIMGMSGVAHAGILLMGIIASLSVDWAFPAVMFYLLTYALASFGVFEVMLHIAGKEDADQEIDHYDQLLKREPFLGATLIVGLGSLAGIPPLAGFIAKLLIFLAAFQAELYWLLGFALAGVVVSIYYYFSWMRAAVMANPFLEEGTIRLPRAPDLGARITMGLLIAGLLVFGFYQGMIFS